MSVTRILLQHFLLAAAFATAPVAIVAGIYTGPVEETAYTDLVAAVDAKRAELAAMITRAEDAGIPTEYARVSQVTIDLFRDVFVPWDRGHPAEVQAMYDAKYFSRFDPVGPTALAFDELADCLEVADAAARELERQMSGALALKRPPDFSSGDVRLEGTNYRLNGQAVFPSYFFWHPFDEALMQAYGRSGEGYLAVTDLGPDGHVRTWKRDNLVDLMSRQSAARRSPIQFFLGHVLGADAWQRSAHPEVFDAGGRLFTDYDIDDPLVREWLGTLFAEQMTPAVAACGSSARVHMLANEPTFPIREGGVQAENGVSEYTLEKYHTWLQAKYGDIDSLNAIYSTAFSSFDAVSFPLPLPLAYQGGPVWYDWCRFNMARVNDWFTYLHDSAHAVDPAGATHIKLMGERSLHFEYRDEGLDFEFITRLVDMPGSDSQMTPLDADWDVRFDQDWRDRYSLEWRAQAIMLDFVRSIAPEKPYYDSEWHGLSGSRWRAFHMSPRYVRAALWLACSGGMGSVNAWVWNRNPDGSIDTRADFIGTVVTQPLVLDAFGRTMKEINAHGDAVAGLVSTVRPFLVYYCEDAAIQDPTYTGSMADVYEALKVLNVPVGFVTAQGLATVDKSSQTVIVPPTAFISDTDLGGLGAFVAAGGKVVLVDGVRSFLKNELGFARKSGPGFVPFAGVELGGVFAMADTFRTVLAPRWPAQPVQVTVTDGAGSPAYGVLASQYRERDAGRGVVSLINTSREPRQVKLALDGETPATVRDLLQGRAYPNIFTMQPMDVLLLRLSDQGETGNQLLNLSTRGIVGTGDDLLIAGLALTGTERRQVLVRASGETLAEEFGVGAAVRDTIVRVFDAEGKLIGENDDWDAVAEAPDISVATAAVGAFPFRAGSRDSAMLLNLAPGQYTVQVSGKNDETGVALIEAYSLPLSRAGSS